MSGELPALLLSLALEAPVLLLLARAQPWPRRLPAAVLPTLLTHPLAWEMAGRLGPDDYRTGYVLIESAVVLAEAAVISLVLRWRPGRALLASALANAGSALLGGALLLVFNGAWSTLISCSACGAKPRLSSLPATAEARIATAPSALCAGRRGRQ